MRCNPNRLVVALNYSIKNIALLSEFSLALALAVCALNTGCSTVSQAGNAATTEPGGRVTAISDNHRGPIISVSPTDAVIVSQGTEHFAATVIGTPNTGVAWSASEGTISSSGAFTAPKVNSNTLITVTATSLTHRRIKASTNVTVTPASRLAITTWSLPAVNTGVSYSSSLAATGGTSPYRWSLASGSLPGGIHLQSSTGALSGTTLLSGSYNFTARVTDSEGISSNHAFKLVVSSEAGNGYDGPAQLPLVYMQTAMSNTPAPGATIAVPAGGDLQSALNRANCGDTIALQAAATFTGVFTLPAKNCDDNHWIIVRSNADDSLLPAEGNRLNPCYAGVASLPGRPEFHCTNNTNVLAKLVMPRSGNGPIIFASGANHYRLIGLEITRTPGSGVVYSLSSTAGTTNHLILDRVWIHGTAQDETKKGFLLAGASYAGIIDSFVTNIQCIAVSGACTDSSAVGGGIDPVGPFKIVNNFLEAAGENILFGGGPSSITPADIEIRHNHMFKPLTWLKGQPGYVGGANGDPFIVKNLLEFKNARRVLVEGNVMENAWGGFSQNGYAVLLTPKNQAGSATTNLCPKCLVTDVTIRYNLISHVGNGLQIANVLSDAHGGALDGQRYSIHDLVIDDIDPVKYKGTGHLAEIMSVAGTALLQNVAINHITAFPPSGAFSIGNTTGTKIPNFIVNNSLITAGRYPIWSTGGGAANCAYYDRPLTTLTTCFSPALFAHNAIIASPSAYPPSSWPVGNVFPAAVSAVQFVNYNGGIGGDYHLLPSSPYKNAASDGKDLGADVDTMLSETTNAY